MSPPVRSHAVRTRSSRDVAETAEAMSMGILPRGRQSRSRAGLVAAIFAILWLVVIVAGHLLTSCLSYFSRADVLFSLTSGVVSTAVLLAIGLVAHPASLRLLGQFLAGLLAGMNIVPSYTILLALLFAGVGISIPPRLETGASPLMRLIGIGLVTIGALLGYRVAYFLVGTVPPVVCP